MGDYIVRATAAGGQVRAFAATTKGLVEEAKERHNMSPIATVALGRLLTGGAMMGAMMKNDADILTVQIKGNGPIGSMTVTANPKGEVKGFVGNPQVMLPLKDGKLDIADAVGIGVLSVIKDIGLKEPYVGDTILITSEIADDLTYYFANSEQVPSSVGLGVLMNKDNTVEQAGGFIIQLMPGATDEFIDKLEARIKEIKSVTAMLEEGMTPEQILEHILGDMELEILDTIPTKFYCNCSKDRVSKAVISV
ncbi:MAG: Hsp33 family molecular chaperone HslO, partial [Lachnospira eligens]|nr:Hsp33 family molecular chaperone HslO [Lachnospira eligens]